jgi:hypothetical protein
MSRSARSKDRYAGELARWARALACARPESIRGAVTDRAAFEEVERFIEDNLNKRLEKLEWQVEFVMPAFKDMAKLMEDYMRAQPLAAYASAASDGEGFLVWLEQTRKLTPVQRDHVVCQRVRHAAEAAARANLCGHLRFQELWSVAGTLAADLDDNPGLLVHLNPIHAWAQFTTRALVDEEATLPAEVVFFPVGSAIHTAVLEPDARAGVEALARCGPCTLSRWQTAVGDADREELIALGRDLAALGMVAFS